MREVYLKRWLQRLGLAVAATVVALTGAVFQAGPAYANRCFYDSDWLLYNNQLHTWANRQCVNQGTVVGWTTCWSDSTPPQEVSWAPG